MENNVNWRKALPTCSRAGSLALCAFREAGWVTFIIKPGALHIVFKFFSLTLTLWWRFVCQVSFFPNVCFPISSKASLCVCLGVSQRGRLLPAACCWAVGTGRPSSWPHWGLGRGAVSCCWVCLAVFLRWRVPAVLFLQAS